MQLTVRTEEDPMGGYLTSGKSGYGYGKIGKSGYGKSGYGYGKTGKTTKGGFASSLDWSIKIVQVSPGVAGFLPDVLGAQVGESLQAQQFDIVTWGNTTAETHQPVRTDNGQPLCDPIAAGGSSAPQFVVQGAVGDTITYTCGKHPQNPQEKGSITIVPNFT
jgi:hypothetical protein